MQLFKEYLKGTDGEKLWKLWIDIEKSADISEYCEMRKFTIFPMLFNITSIYAVFMLYVCRSTRIILYIMP